MNERSDIGEQLQEAREKRGLSLTEVAHETRIPLATLESLEANDYSSFASTAYTKSFLNQYSDYLKIDAHEILESFSTGNVLDQSDGIEYINQEKSSNTRNSPQIRRGPAPASKGTSSNISQPLLILLITGGLIAGGIWGFITVEKRLNAESEPTAENTPETVDEPDEATVPPPKATPIASTPPPREVDRPARTISPLNPTAIASTPTESVEEDLDGPVYVFPEDTPPPRAIIVNEDEDE